MLKSTIALLVITGAIVVAARLANAQNPAKNLPVGDPKVETVSNYTGPDPLPKPVRILVYDFVVPSNVVSMDESMAARIHRRHTLLRGSDDEASPEDVAQHVQAAFSKALVSELQKVSVPVDLAQGSDTAIPGHILMVHGDFTAVNEGDRSKRVMIGFGRGASDVQAHVTVALTTEGQPILLSEFNLKSESGKKPGAAATMGVGSAAAGAATGSAGDKKATVEADASRMAKDVAKQIEQQMANQKWISFPQPQKN